MSLLKPSFSLRPSSAKLASPLKVKTQPSSDLFVEFETFRAQIKREYNDRLLQTKPVMGKDDFFKNNSSKTNIYSTLPIKSSNKENLEEKANFFEKNTRKSPSQIENIKKSLKELSAKKPENSLHLQREFGSIRISELKKDLKKPADFKSLLTSFETAKPGFDTLKNTDNLKNSDNWKNMKNMKNSEKFENSSFDTQKINFEAQKQKFLRISPTKRVKSDLLNTFESSSKKIGGFGDKRILGKVLELQENLIDLNDQEFNDCGNQYFSLFFI